METIQIDSMRFTISTNSEIVLKRQEMLFSVTCKTRWDCSINFYSTHIGYLQALNLYFIHSTMPNNMEYNSFIHWKGFCKSRYYIYELLDYNEAIKYCQSKKVGWEMLLDMLQVMGILE